MLSRIQMVHQHNYKLNPFVNSHHETGAATDCEKYATFMWILQVVNIIKYT